MRANGKDRVEVELSLVEGGPIDNPLCLSDYEPLSLGCEAILGGVNRLLMNREIVVVRALS